MDIRTVTAESLRTYLNLCQAYEGEFSAITGKLPDADGLFALDTELGGDITGYLLYWEGRPAGFAAIRTGGGEGSEVCEFYIVPSVRRKCLGRDFARRLFSMHPGRWQVKQLQGAGYATCFWVKVIDEFTGSNFTQDDYEDRYWGKVARQCFLSECGEDD